MQALRIRVWEFRVREPFVSEARADDDRPLRLLDRLVCPVDRTPLRVEADTLVSDGGRRYAVVDGIPVLLVEGDQTLWVAHNSRRHLANGPADPFFIDSLGVSPEEAATIRQFIADGTSPVDPVVSCLVGATNGIAYKHLVGKLQEYPIPEIRLSPGQGKSLLV